MHLFVSLRRDIFSRLVLSPVLSLFERVNTKFDSIFDWSKQYSIVVASPVLQMCKKDAYVKDILMIQ